MSGVTITKGLSIASQLLAMPLRALGIRTTTGKR